MSWKKKVEEYKDKKDIYSILRMSGGFEDYSDEKFDAHGIYEKGIYAEMYEDYSINVFNKDGHVIAVVPALKD